MSLKKLDLFVCLKLAIWAEASWTYAALGDALGLSASEANASVKRSLAAGLLTPARSGEDAKPMAARQGLLEFIRHGIRYAFFESPGRTRRGMPTAHSAPPLHAILQPGAAPPLVWPDPEGEARGQVFQPLYKTVPAAAKKDPALYEVLALVDAIRGGRARERELGFELLAERISRPDGD
ncbi:MAG TPA: hypothetical protein ENJ09_00300 [Planctomycetes bacterium]|nr:hypothetical protein [Planctomycetota bacterium]